VSLVPQPHEARRHGSSARPPPAQLFPLASLHCPHRLRPPTGPLPAADPFPGHRPGGGQAPAGGQPQGTVLLRAAHAHSCRPDGAGGWGQALPLALRRRCRLVAKRVRWTPPSCCCRLDIASAHPPAVLQGYLAALSASAYSLISMMQRFGPHMNEGGAVVSLTYNASQRIIPGYGGGMSSAKAVSRCACLSGSFASTFSDRCNMQGFPHSVGLWFAAVIVKRLPGGLPL
jgi:hypothetical protein